MSFSVNFIFISSVEYFLSCNTITAMNKRTLNIKLKLKTNKSNFSYLLLFIDICIKNIISIFQFYSILDVKSIFEN